MQVASRVGNRIEYLLSSYCRQSVFYCILKMARRTRRFLLHFFVNLNPLCRNHSGQKLKKNPINGLSKFKFEKPFYVIFVIVILNWQIWCGFLTVNVLVLRENGARCNMHSKNWFKKLSQCDLLSIGFRFCKGNRMGGIKLMAQNGHPFLYAKFQRNMSFLQKYTYFITE